MSYTVKGFREEATSLSLSVTCALLRNVSTLQMCKKGFFANFEKTLMLTSWTRAMCYLIADSMTSMACWKVLGALLTPNDIQINWCSP